MNPHLGRRGAARESSVRTVASAIVVLVVMLSRFRLAFSADCTIVTSLVSACSSFVTYGSPDPIPGSPCCVAMTSLNNLADSGDNIRTVCRCLMDLITTYSPNATAIATLPGFCGVSLGFTIDPNTDCE
ncbi:putative non-specific lipid-transfer protein 14 isoform X2 [Henckelia pumila]|uniref:putative non-specific lipid-transfer protein 14 isoform X2 n=1 Tax=Henckelia pumila TaxID=405737 RepID=UPI003C6DEF10